MNLSNREELILLSIGLLQGNAYGYHIAKEFEEHTGKRISLASIHTILYRLEGNGLLSSELGGSTNKRGGRRKRIYSLTGYGIETIRAIQNARTKIWSQLDGIISPELGQAT